MTYRPTFDEFAKLAKGHSVVPVYRRLVADTLTPVSAFVKVREGDWAFLFESVVGGERVGRYSFLGAGPFLRFQAAGRTVEATKADGGTVDGFPADDPLKSLEHLIGRYTAPDTPDLPRFCGGAVGYAGYDVVRYAEKLPHAPPDDRGIPDLSFAFYDRMVIFDHITKVVNVVAHAHTAAATADGLRWAYADACRRVDDTVRRLQQGVADLPLADVDPTAGVPAREGRAAVLPDRFRSNMSRERFEAGVAKAKEYILAGDAFQVVLSQRFRTDTRARPFDIYRALRVINPSPFMVYVQAGPVTLIGASPEIMCRVEGRQMTVRPLAGTRRRGATPAEDDRLAAELVADPKERAEHVMLVDLGRNDVGKVCRAGSVAVPELMAVEKYSHVMHISSTVTGTLAADRTAFDAIRAALPAGTLSGAPKVRAMEIIDELEPTRRGPYGGAVGYVDFRGNTDTCIALRTMVLVGQTADIQAGAGVVADSDPAAEYQETVDKALGLLRAVEVAETQL